MNNTPRDSAYETAAAVAAAVAERAAQQAPDPELAAWLAAQRAGAWTRAGC